jgi:hypothetical protein
MEDISEIDTVFIALSMGFSWDSHAHKFWWGSCRCCSSSSCYHVKIKLTPKIATFLLLLIFLLSNRSKVDSRGLAWMGEFDKILIVDICIPRIISKTYFYFLELWGYFEEYSCQVQSYILKTVNSQTQCRKVP